MFDELLNRIKLRAGQIITQKWYDDLAELFLYIKNETGIGGRIPLSKLPDGELGKVLIAQGIGNDPVYADPDCNIVKIAGTNLTPRNWSNDFEKLQNLDTLLSTRASETRLSEVSSKISDVNDKLIDLETKIDSLIAKIDSLNEKLDFLKFDDKSLGVSSRLMHYAEIGYGFHLFERYENVANNATETLYLQNPSDSTRIVYIAGIEISTLAQLFINGYRNPTITNPGSEIITLNLRFGHPNTSSLIARKSVSFESDTPLAKMLVPGGAKSSAIGSFSAIGEGIIIPPDNALLLQFINNSGASTSFAVRVLWFEIE